MINIVNTKYYMQFDNDEPIEIFSNIGKQKLVLTIEPTEPEGKLTFTSERDKKTGLQKTFTIFAKNE